MTRAPFVIRTAERTDLNALAALEQRAGDVRWSYAQVEQELSAERSRIHVLSVDASLIGYGVYWKVLDEAQVANIVIAPGERRKGWGAELLGHLLNEAKKEGCRRATLEVRACNTGALALYQRNGFNVVGRRTQFYRDPIDDAILMEKLF